MSFERLAPVEGSGHPCLNCAASGAHGSHETLHMDRLLAVGFGDCYASRDGVHVYEEAMADGDAYWTAADAEKAAMADPDHDWRVSFLAPLYEAEYQRQGESHWVLVRKGQGFA